MCVLTVDENEAMRRDFLNSISLEKRRKLTVEKLRSFNTSISNLVPHFLQVVGHVQSIDTTYDTVVDTSMGIADTMITEYQKKLIKEINNEIRR